MKTNATKESDNEVQLIIIYNSKWREVRKALDKYWDILHSVQIPGKYIAAHPSLTYWRPNNVKDILVHSYHAGLCMER